MVHVSLCFRAGERAPCASVRRTLFFCRIGRGLSVVCHCSLIGKVNRSRDVCTCATRMCRGPYYFYGPIMAYILPPTISYVTIEIQIVDRVECASVRVCERPAELNKFVAPHYLAIYRSQHMHHLSAVCTIRYDFFCALARTRVSTMLSHRFRSDFLPGCGNLRFAGTVHPLNVSVFSNNRTAGWRVCVCVRARARYPNGIRSHMLITQIKDNATGCWLHCEHSGLNAFGNE